MENNQNIQSGGLWNSARPVLSAGTQNLLKVMMQESKLTNFQRRKISESAERGQSLPTKVGPSFTIVDKKKPQPKKESKVIDPHSHKNSLRNYEAIVNSGAYEKSDYKPPMRKARTDQDKDHLVKVMAFGNDPSKWPKEKKRVEIEEDYEPAPEIDRFEELKSEINERVEFLDQMGRVGKRREYEAMIKVEISQKIREMEVIDMQRTAELNELLKAKTRDLV